MKGKPKLWDNLIKKKKKSLDHTNLGLSFTCFVRVLKFLLALQGKESENHRRWVMRDVYAG